jgi:ribose-phosphate pyrophosphokinase
MLFAADALRRQGVAEIGLVAPYLAYMRQDRVFEPGQSLSQHVMASDYAASTLSTILHYGY